MKTKTLWVRDEYLRYILDGRKTIEVRVAYANIVRLRPGDRLLLNGGHPFSIREIGRYGGFAELLDGERTEAIAPGLTRDELLETLHSIYPADKEALGVVALYIEPEEGGT